MTYKNGDVVNANDINKAIDDSTTALNTANTAKTASDKASADVIDLSKQIGTKQGTTITENGIPMPTYNIDIKADKADVLGAINATEISGEQIYISNTNNGFADKIDIVGNTIGGGGTTTAPNSIISVENPINIVSNSKNLYNTFDTVFSYYNNNIVPNIQSSVLANKISFNSNGNNGVGAVFRINTDIEKSYTVSATLSISKYICSYRQFFVNFVSYDKLGNVINSPNLVSTPPSSNFYYESVYSGYANYNIANSSTDFTDVNISYSFKILSNDVKSVGVKIGYYAYDLQSGMDIINPQLEVGSVATAYEPYEKSAFSISVKGADATLYPIRKINNNYYDRVFKDTDGKWYLEKKVGEASANITNAIPNSPYLGTMTIGGTATASGGIIVKSGETIDYALATPQKIILDQTEAQKLEIIRTYLGGTVISSNQTTGASPIFDVAEMTIGNRKQKAVVLVDNDSNAVFPMTKADCVIMSDGTTIEYALNKTKSQWFNPSSTTKLKFDVYYQLAYSLGSGNSYLIAFGIFSINSNTKAYEFPNVEVISKPNNDHYSMRLRNGNEIPEFEVYLNGFLISPTPYSKIWIKELF